MKSIAVLLFLISSGIGFQATASEVITLITPAETKAFYQQAHGEVRQADSTTFEMTPGQPDTRECKILVDAVFRDLKDQADQRCQGGQEQARYLISNPGHVRYATEWGDFESQIDVVTPDAITNCASFMKQKENSGVTRTIVSKGAFQCKQGLKKTADREENSKSDES